MSFEAIRQSGIGRRISRLVASAVFASVLAAAVTVVIIQTNRDLATKRAVIEQTGYVLAATVADAVYNRRADDIRLAMRSVSRLPNILSVTATTESGRVLASLGQSAMLESDVVAPSSSNLSFLYKGTLPVSVEIVKNGKTAGQLVLVADIHGARTTFVATLVITLLAALLTAIAGVVLSKPLQRKIVSPLLRLTNVISSIRSTRDYSHNIEDPSAVDEVSVLIDSFNGLMTDIRSRDSALQRLAFIDQLTGLGNRAHFQRLLEDWVPRQAGKQEAGAVLLFSIHGFGSINNAFGHSIGDAVLLSVAATLHEITGKTADLARTGTAEYAYLVRSTENSAALVDELIQKIQTAFDTPVKILDFDLDIKLDIGVALMPVVGLAAEGASAAPRAARLALNVARQKSPGKAVYFAPLMDEAVRRETELGQALRHAIEGNELEAFFQLQYDVRTGRVSGFEALARWRHPVKGFIPPSEFIPVAEHTGLIAPLGDWILRESCRQAKMWLNEGHAPRIMSVNVSPAQLLDADFTEKVRNALEAADLPPSLLCLEITESVFVGTKADVVQATLRSIAGVGVKLALDDFGTGYSSLGTLANLPFHKLKIDRSFVTEAEKSPRKTELLKSVITMAHALNMTVVAEGAETIQELSLLSKLKADEVQGYVVSRPLAAKDALVMAREVESRTGMALAAAS